MMASGGGERAACQAEGCARTVRAPAQGASGCLWRGDTGVAAPEKIGVPVGQGRELMVSVQQGLCLDGCEVSMAWGGGHGGACTAGQRRLVRVVKPALVGPIKALIEEEEPSFGYRTVAGLLRMNKNTVQRIFQLKGWQVRKRAVGRRPRIEALPSVATAHTIAVQRTCAGSGRLRR